MEDLEYDFTESQTELAKQVQINVQLSADVSKAKAQFADALAQIQELQDQLSSQYDEVPDGNVQALLDSKGEGAIINLPPEEFRLSQPLRPLKNQTIIGHDTEFKGSIVVGTWEKEGNYYIASGQLPSIMFADQGVCEIISGPDANGCRVLEDVFNGGKKMERVMQLANLGPGKVYSDYLANKIYITDVPNKVELARAYYFMNSDVDGVVLAGLRVSQFASPSQRGALTISGKGWEVMNCLFTQNHSSGLHCTGADGIDVHDNTFEYNGQAGMTHHKTMDSIIEYNTFRGNNTNDYYRRDWESAGLKITYSQRVRIEANTSEWNLGVGIWADIDNKNIYIIGNKVNNNFSCGIRYEISFDGEIRGNTLEGNGFGHAGPGRGSDYSGFAIAAIHVNSAGGMDDGVLLIQDNILGVNQNGIHVEERNRGKSVTYPTYNWTARNVHVLDNTVNLTQSVQGYGTGVVGLGQLGTVVSDVYKAGNIFEGNKYLIKNSADPQFHVKDTAVNQYKTFARWQALGYDKTGSLTTLV